MNKTEINEKLIGVVKLGLPDENILSILEKGADIHYRTFIGWTPLMFAIYNGHLETVQFLLDKGANVHDVYDDISLLRFAEIALDRAEQIRDIISKKITIRNKNHD